MLYLVLLFYTFARPVLYDRWPRLPPSLPVALALTLQLPCHLFFLTLSHKFVLLRITIFFGFCVSLPIPLLVWIHTVCTKYLHQRMI